jgi:hypothetical protein
MENSGALQDNMAAAWLPARARSGAAKRRWHGRDAKCQARRSGTKKW